MNISEKNLEKARNLLNELSNLEAAIDVLSNYDSKIDICFTTFYNHNIKTTKKVSIPASLKVISIVRKEIDNRIHDIKAELEEM